MCMSSHFPQCMELGATASSLMCWKCWSSPLRTRAWSLPDTVCAGRSLFQLLACVWVLGATTNSLYMGGSFLWNEGACVHLFYLFSCLCLHNAYCRYVLSHLLPAYYSDVMNRSVWMRWPGKLALFLCSRRSPLDAQYRVDVHLYRILCTRLVGVTYCGCLHTVSMNVVCPLWSRSCSVWTSRSFFSGVGFCCLFLGFKTCHCPSRAYYADRDRTPLNL
jgi:hypothetical protein